MASLRGIKNDIDYLVSEVISDCYMALYFNDQSKREMIQRANHPADKQNKSLVKKHYAQMRRDMMTRIDALFGKLSDICK